MGCESCSSGSCSTNSKDGLPPGICADSDSVRQTADCVAG